MACNKEQVIVLLKDMMERIRTEEDPVELNELRKLFRKNVPLTLRSYAAAYFMKLLLSDGNRAGRQGRGRDRNARGSRKPPYREDAGAENCLREDRGDDKVRTVRREPYRTSLAEELSTTIFVGIGRNRRVFPRDLVSLISQGAGLDRSRIGDIRVLDNYSFVQLLAEDAEAAISRLDGYEYRGRKLSVSYSRKKEESQLEETSEDYLLSDDLSQDSMPGGLDDCDDYVSFPEQEAEESESREESVSEQSNGYEQKTGGF